MTCRNIASVICVFVAAVTATAHNDSHSVTGSGPEVRVYPLTAENPESSTKEPGAMDLGALLDAGDDAVITLVIGDTRLAVHRAVLVDRSPVFAATLQRMTLETSGGQVVIPDVEGAVLRQLLSYMYALQIPYLPRMAPQLLAAADMYGLYSLKARCEPQVAAHLSVENAAATAVLAVKHSCASLRQDAISFIKDHILPVVATQGWADMMNSQPEYLMKVIRLLSDAPVEARSLSAEERNRRLIDVRDENRRTALHWAAHRGDVQAVRRLLAAGAAVDARDIWQVTPLHVAAYWGHVAVVRLLVEEASADPNARNKEGWTPLYGAAAHGNAEVAAFLLQAGADKRATDNWGQTPLDIARQNNHQQLVDMLT